MDPSKRCLTVVLGAGVVVLLAAILLGEQMGSRVIVTASSSKMPSQILVTPAPTTSGGPFGPDWKRSQTLAAPPDPGFPDPRVPPQPLPTPVAPKATPTPRKHELPIWDQTFPPSSTPAESPTPTPIEEASTKPLPDPSPR